MNLKHIVFDSSQITQIIKDELDLDHWCLIYESIYVIFFFLNKSDYVVNNQ